MTHPIYLDYAATTPMAPEVALAMAQCLTLEGDFANPASLQHSLGERAYHLVETARSDIAELLNCKANDLVFTSGATEANNLALKGLAFSPQNTRKHIVTSATEHKAILDTCHSLETQGFTVTYLKPDHNGLINLETLLDAITPDTFLVSLMHVNNETGVIQNIEAIAQALQEKQQAFPNHTLYFHVDAAQSVGKLAIDLSQTPIDLLSVSAHKCYGPKGIGCLYIRNRKRQHLMPLMHGGGQEFGLRPGTLPTHQIIGMATAFKLAAQSLEKDQQHAEHLAQLLTEQLNTLKGVHFNGNQQQKLASIFNISFDDVGSDSLMIHLKEQLAIANGSACNTGTIEASHVLRAIGIEGDRLYGAVRISFGRYTTAQDILYAGQHLYNEVLRLRQLAIEL
ncbi:MAG: aminotransferase class V-fold PLP-dependent enzyme [Methylococcales bacterium]|nr:MAG: aminotransferase class V-fold PLP-dependent enzyme [Methylococcales bacterium]